MGVAVRVSAREDILKKILSFYEPRDRAVVEGAFEDVISNRGHALTLWEFTCAVVDEANGRLNRWKSPFGSFKDGVLF